MRPIFFTAVLTQANIISRSSPPKGVPVCYFPNHEIAPNNYACDLSSKVSFCCGIDAICLDNKICLNTVNEHIRGACTDKTWRSPDCPQYCTGASTGGTDIISCANVTNSLLDYCCDPPIGQCCDTGVGRFRLADAGVAIKTLGSSAITATRHLSSSITRSASASASGGSTASSSSEGVKTNGQTDSPTVSPSSPAASSNSGLSTGAKLGLGVAIPTVIIIIIVLSIILWRRRSHKKATVRQQSSEPQYEKPELDSRNNNVVQTGPQELPGERGLELPTDSRWELPS